MVCMRINTGTYTQAKCQLLIAIVVDVDVDLPIEVRAGFRWPASSGAALVRASTSGAINSLL